MTMSPDLRDRTILIVDDNQANLALAVGVLKQQGLRLSVAQSGDEALRRVAFAPPDLILLDVVLPGIDGFEVCRRLKAGAATIAAVPVIFMTALNSTADKVAGFRAGAVDYVTKPLQAEELLARVTTHLRLAAMQARLANQNTLLANENRERREAERVLQHYRDNLERQVAARTVELRESEIKFRTLSENLPDPIVRYDCALHRTYVNPAYEQLLWQGSAEALGRMLPQDWRADLSLPQYQAVLQSVIDSGEPAAIDLRVQADGGAPLEVAVRMAAERGADGDITGVLAISRDVTAHKQAERDLAASHAQLRELGAHRESAREDERKHIARELHDELGQSLTALRMQAALLRVRFGADVPDLNEQVHNMTALVDRTIGVVRNVATTLRPSVLDLGIGSALEWLVDELRQHSGIDCSLTLTLDEGCLNEPQAIAVFRIVQESLTNVARHADASEAAVTLCCFADHCLLQIDDNGGGFDPARLRPRSFGLLGIRERVLSLNGEVTIGRRSGGGTRIAVILPLAQ
ncbi:MULTISPECIES: response regulator [unclassified Duganella]|uniref:hybrid sensor histidine kinase/response regulator n=1 Tax=unclassified Duganella TaxID=2636909 RepID=UPI000E347613|nr:MULTISPECIES: response regulator [unclassified Duganella]RFP09257.1 response regulator [Duganella sp. BJB475]RFP25292.1 response regulator [Duganella sp. BJB476]